MDNQQAKYSLKDHQTTNRIRPASRPILLGSLHLQAEESLRIIFVLKLQYFIKLQPVKDMI